MKALLNLCLEKVLDSVNIEIRGRVNVKFSGFSAKFEIATQIQLILA